MELDPKGLEAAKKVYYRFELSNKGLVVEIIEAYLKAIAKKAK